MPSAPPTFSGIHVFPIDRFEEQVKVPEIPIAEWLVDKLEGVGKAAQTWVISANVGARTVFTPARHAHPEVSDEVSIEPTVAGHQGMKVSRCPRHPAARKPLLIAS